MQLHFMYTPTRSGSTFARVAVHLAVGVLSSFALSQGYAGSANPLVAPPPSVKMEPGAKTLTVPLPSAQQPVMQQSSPNPVGVGQGQTLPTQEVFPPEKWLAQAVVTSTVGDRASIMVPLSLNEALAINTSTNQSRGPGGVQMQNFQSAFPPGSIPGGQGAPGNGAGKASTQNQPQVAAQQTRQEIIYVKTGRPFFFKGEKFSVEVSGREVMIWRPGKPKKGAEEMRDIVYVGSVSSTELLRAPIVGPYAVTDPDVVKRITPVYAGSTASSSSGSSSAPGAGAGAGSGGSK